MMFLNSKHTKLLSSNSPKVAVLCIVAAAMFNSASHAELIIHRESVEPVDDTVMVETAVEKDPRTELSTASGIHSDDIPELKRQSSPSQSFEVLAYRQTPSEDSIINLMQVLRVDDQIDRIVDSQMSMQNILQNQSIQTATESDEEVNERQQQIAESMEKLLGEYSEILNTGLNEKLSKESLTQSYIEAAQNHYSQQQVDALIEFYDTPMGQSIIDSNQLVNAEFLKSTVPDEEEMERVQEQFERLGPLIEEMMKDVF